MGADSMEGDELRRGLRRGGECTPRTGLATVRGALARASLSFGIPGGNSVRQTSSTCCSGSKMRPGWRYSGGPFAVKPQSARWLCSSPRFRVPSWTHLLCHWPGIRPFLSMEHPVSCSMNEPMGGTQ